MLPRLVYLAAGGAGSEGARECEVLATNHPSFLTLATAQSSSKQAPAPAAPTCVGVQIEQNAADARGVTQHRARSVVQVRGQQRHATLQQG